MRIGILLLLILVLATTFLSTQSNEIQFIFTSDSHYGLTRASFHGMDNVDAHVVNAAMISRINRLPKETFPSDGGLGSSRMVGTIDFIVDGGDIANREESATGIQSAASSWKQFRLDYVDGLNLLDRIGRKAPLYVVPGNHDASNAIGHYKTMTPAVDKTSMVEIYNLMMAPDVPKTPATFDYSRDKIEVSHDIGGIHFIYLTIWPDAGARAWMEKDLKRVDRNMPVMIFTHDPPDADSKHFTNPNGKHDINDIDKFENLLPEMLNDEIDHVQASTAAPLSEQKDLEDFLRKHPTVTAYFHGHSNWNQFYDWTGPAHGVTLHTFRVDSPMKGHFSAEDETKLSFQIATIDMASRTMTVREVLWNADPQHPDAAMSWGASTTIALAPRPSAAK